jgi:Rps23 Pro-64 3,4-dihydroxylase Tpa1-like proline 4-hydroxylase
MTRRKVTEISVEPRTVNVRVELSGGHSHTLTLREDAPELRELFTTLVTPERADAFVQLPLRGGRSACSFRPSQLVAIVTEPPVVVHLELPKAAAPAGAAPASAARIRPPRYVVIDDFLSPSEHRDMLAYALALERTFEPGTVTSYDPGFRQNLVIMDFGATEHSKLIQNRLLVWCPLLAQTFGEPVFPLESVESQLTAGNDGHFFKQHSDSGATEAVRLRALSCVYFFHREPKGFAGGELRLYDTREEGERRVPAETFQVVEPVSNRLAVFPSREYHEVVAVRCPSRAFADSRFAVTSWIRRADAPDAERRFGWGHFRCGDVAPQLNGVVRA